MAKLLDEAFAGKKGWITGIVNEQSIAYGCATDFRRLGADVVVTYLNDKAKPYVEPLARELGVPRFLPLDVRVGASTAARSAWMRIMAWPLALAILVAPAAPTLARAAEPPPPAPGISQEAADAVARMGKAVAVKELVFTARTVRVFLDETGQPLHIFHNLKAVFRRPNRLAIELVGDDGVHQLLYDGKSATLIAPESNQYALLAVSGDISSAINEVLDKLHMDFPLADFFTEAPDKSLLDGAIGGWLVGISNVDGVDCRHLFFVKRGGVEVELWLENNEASVPHRVIVTYRLLPGQPGFIAELTSWDARVRPSDADFVFKPPAGARRVELDAPAAPGAEGSNR